MMTSTVLHNNITIGGI